MLETQEPTLTLKIGDIVRTVLMIPVFTGEQPEWRTLTKRTKIVRHIFEPGYTFSMAGDSSETTPGDQFFSSTRRPPSMEEVSVSRVIQDSATALLFIYLGNINDQDLAPELKQIRWTF